MPHLILEHSSTLKNFNPEKFFEESHRFLEKYTDIESCKSRRVICKDTYVGKGNLDSAFFSHLTVLIMPGRSEEIIQDIGNTLHQILKRNLDPLLKISNLKGDITVEVKLLQAYFKN
tara:strand:+ start:7133 stop:7483 length:351 start_codon:yes stop_codon:yes gene_type:complete